MKSFSDSLKLLRILSKILTMVTVNLVFHRFANIILLHLVCVVVFLLLDKVIVTFLWKAVPCIRVKQAVHFLVWEVFPRVETPSQVF